TTRYSPISFFFNFSHNVVKGAVIDALLNAEPWRLTVNELLTGISGGDEQNAAKEKLATTLMGYARANPHRIRGQLMPVIVYDPAAGRRAYSVAIQKLKEQPGQRGVQPFSSRVSRSSRTPARRRQPSRRRIRGSRPSR